MWTPLSFNQIAGGAYDLGSLPLAKIVCTSRRPLTAPLTLHSVEKELVFQDAVTSKNCVIVTSPITITSEYHRLQLFIQFLLPLNPQLVSLWKLRNDFVMCQEGANLVAKAALGGVFATAEQPKTRDPSFTTREKHQSDEATIFQGNILTLVNGRFSSVDAISIKGDTITSVGSLTDVQGVAGADAPVRVLGERQAIVPGFIDPHLHLLFTALVSNHESILNFSPSVVKTIADARAIVERALVKKTSGEWIVGFGYDPSLAQGHPNLTLDITNAWAAENPVYIINQSGHVAYVNQLALDFAKISEDIKDSNFHRGPDGKLDGVLFEEAVSVFSPFIPKISPEAFVGLARTTLKSWAARGTTTVFDAGIGLTSGWPEIAVIKSVLEDPLLPRFGGAIAIQTVQPFVSFLEALAPPPWSIGAARVQAIKFWLDGSTQGFTAAVKEPYLNQPDNLGILNYQSDEKILRLLVPFLQSGWQLILHTNGDRAIDQALRVLHTAFNAVPNRNREIMHRLEHVTVVSKEQLVRAAELGLGVSHLIAHVRNWGAVFRDYVLGPPRGERIDPTRDDVDVGVIYSFHSDSPISPVNPLQYVDTAVARLIDATGEVLGEEQTVTLEEAWRGVTINPARQIGLAAEIGSLEVGKKADFLVLGKDPRLVQPGYLHKEVEVLETWVSGRKIYGGEDDALDT
jgi:predicted amidohydrolase YtcJ